MTDSLFRKDGDLYYPTALTEGPWFPGTQHGGPPAALLSGAIEKTPSDAEMMVARVTIELLRPVPLKPMRVTTELVRPGKKVQLIAATLTDDDTEVARALGLRIRLAKTEAPSHQPGETIPPVSDGVAPNFFDMPGGFATEGMEIKMIGGDFNRAGPGQAWLRLRVPLVAGEETTSVERVAAAADFGNGVSNLAGDIRDWIFINPDLEIRMYRPPEGEWVYLDSQTRISSLGTGVATSSLGDEKGWLGVSAQSLFVDQAGKS